MKRCILLLTICIYLYPMKVFAENNATPSIVNVTKPADIIISQTKQNVLIPENAVKITKDILLTYIIPRIRWSAWSWVDKGSYYCIWFEPTIYVDDMILAINYPKHIFSLSTFENPLLHKAINDLENNIFVDDDYYIIIENDTSLRIYTKNLSGPFIVSTFNFVEQ